MPKRPPAPEPTDAAAFQETWAGLELLWEETTARASALAEHLLDERVADEWSFLETLRHLVFVTDAWVGRALLGASDYHPLGLPPTGMTKPAVPQDRDSRPSSSEVLDLRRHRQRVVCELAAGLTDARLEESVRVRGPGHPRAGTYAVRRCLQTVVNEEWHHRLYAERDLAAIERRTS